MLDGVYQFPYNEHIPTNIEDFKMTKRTYTPAQESVALASLVEGQAELIAKLIVTVYENQTNVEKRIRHTVVQNQQGFSKADALAGTVLAERVLNGTADKVELMKWATRGKKGSSRISKYWRQLLAVPV